MARAPVSTSEAPRDAAVVSRALIERQIGVLTRLTEIGMEIAEAAGRRASAPADDDAPAAPDPGLTYSRTARAVRLTIALQSRLLADLDALDRGEAKARAADAAARRSRIHRLVERAIEANLEGEHDGDETDAERLSTEAWERLTDIDPDDLAASPLAEVVAGICRDLGLSPAAVALAVEPFVTAPVPAPLHPAHPHGGGDPGFLPLGDPDGVGLVGNGDEKRRDPAGVYPRAGFPGPGVGGERCECGP